MFQARKSTESKANSNTRDFTLFYFLLLFFFHKFELFTFKTETKAEKAVFCFSKFLVPTVVYELIDNVCVCEKGAQIITSMDHADDCEPHICARTPLKEPNVVHLSHAG